MSKFKAIIGFSDYSDAELAPVAQNIHEHMLANAATFPNPPVDMVAFQGLIDAYTAALAAKASRAIAATIAFTAAREQLENALGLLGGYVNSIAKGVAASVELSGFPSYDTTHTADPSPPAAPADLKLVHGDLSGSIIGRFKPDRDRSMNEVQTNTGDPNDEALWKTVGVFSGGRATLNGIVPGTKLWVRARTLGIRGVTGAWSDPGNIMVV